MEGEVVDMAKTDSRLERGKSTISELNGDVYEAVELHQERFSIWSVVGLQFSCSAAPLAICSFTYLVVGVGGTPYFFWCYLVAVTGQLILFASLAEMAAIYPHASGQIFWAAMLAPRKYARFISYIVGALTFYGWTLALAGCVVFTGDFMVAMGIVITPDFVPQEYQVFAIAFANTLIAWAFNLIGIKWLPKLNKFMVVFLNGSAFLIFVVLLVKANPKASAYDALIKVVNKTGWSSDSFVFLLGFLPGMLTVCLPDASAHMAEEVPNPERAVPLVMFATGVLNAVSGFIMCLTLVFCTVAPENLTAPLGGMPIFQIAKDAWDNFGWIITVGVIMVIVPLNGTISIMTGGSRLLWSFAKHDGIVGGRLIGRTHDGLKVPVNAVLATGTLATLLSLLLFGPSTVLNGIFGCSKLNLGISYFLPVTFMAMKDRKELPEGRYFNLGRYGRIINILTLCWLALSMTAVSLPTYYPVTTSNMNWSSVVFAGLFVLALGNWVFVRNSYKTPKPLHIETLHG